MHKNYVDTSQGLMLSIDDALKAIEEKDEAERRKRREQNYKEAE